MKRLQIELPERVAAELETMVRSGWFVDEAEIIHMALMEFVRRRRFELLEQFQLEDIQWALQPRKPGP